MLVKVQNSIVMGCLSPDSSGNPFLFFFKKEKIATYSGKQLLKTIKQN
jgi:hypothetical protein